MARSGQNIARTHRGFTMMELLAVVAILAIVAAIAFPAFASIQKNMQMLQMDSTAKSIYIAAQQRLSSLGSSGELQVRASTSASTTNAADKIAGLHEKIALPVDYPDRNQSNVELYYLDSTQTADGQILNSYLLTGHDVASTGGRYIIEASPYTGEIYSVIYWENNSYSADEVLAMLQGSRSRDTRSAYGIGYYGGAAVQSSPHVEQPVTLDDLNFQLVNWNDLFVKLTASDLGTALVDSSNLRVDISVTGASGWGTTKTVDLKYTGNSSPEEGYTYVDFSKISGIDNDGKAEVDFLLDSMYGSGNSFATITGNKIIPGADITVSVKVTYKTTTYTSDGADGTTARTGLAPHTDNSLFDSRTTSTAKVSCLRHLNNLRASALGSNGWVWGLNSYSDVVQTYNARNFSSIAADGTMQTALYEPDGVDRNIDFTAANWQNMSVAVEHLSSANRIATAASAAGIPNQPMTYFTPITMSPDGFNNSGGHSFDGKDGNAQYSFKNFTIGDSAKRVDNTGLFDTVMFQLNNIYFYDSKVYGAANTGTIAGYLPDSGSGSMTNCHVISTTGKYGDGTCLVSGGTGTGGLVGTNAKNVTGSSSAADVSGNDSVGGLIGVQTNGTISSCVVGGNPDSTTNDGFVTVKGGTSGMNIGGFIGNMTGGTVTGSTGLANAESDTGSNIGGFVGSVAGGSVSGCAARGYTQLQDGNGAAVAGVASTVTTDGTYAGGFIGKQSAGSITENYAAVDVSPVNDTSTTTSAFGGFVGGIISGSAEKCYSSGTVRAKSTAGGFAGIMSTNWGVRSCYTTSNVYADSTAGGFVGRLSAGWNGSCVSYGRVLTLSGAAGADSNNIHGFVGRKTNGGFSDSYYLWGLNYNDASSDPVAVNKSPDAIKAITVISGKVLTASETHPYSTALRGSAMPYPCIVKSDGTNLAHYGNWATCTPYSIFASIMTGGTPSSTSPKDLWSYFKTDSKNPYLSGNSLKSVDSAAPQTSGFANVTVNINAYLIGKGYDITQCSWRVSIRPKTYALKDDANNGLLKNTTDYTDNFLVYVGDSIPNYNTASEAQVTATYNVVKYDVGRAARGEAAYQRGTIGITNKQNGSTYGYYMYDESSFQATSDWYNPS